VSVVFCQVEVSATSSFTRPEESYRLWCVVMCDLETSWMRSLWPNGGCWAKNKKKLIYSEEVCIESKAFVAELHITITTVEWIFIRNTPVRVTQTVQRCLQAYITHSFANVFYQANNFRPHV
jgi:hypothetical protein